MHIAIPLGSFAKPVDFRCRQGATLGVLNYMWWVAVAIENQTRMDILTALHTCGGSRETCIRIQQCVYIPVCHQLWQVAVGHG